MADLQYRVWGNIAPQDFPFLTLIFIIKKIIPKIDFAPFRI